MTGQPPPNDHGTAPGTGPVPSAGETASEAVAAYDASASPDQWADRDHQGASPAETPGPRIWPRVVGALILILGAGGAWVWQNPGVLQGFLSAGSPNGAALPALEARVARLEQRPVPADAGPMAAQLAARLDALEKRISRDEQTRAPSDLRPLLARLEALEARGGGEPEARPAGSGAPPDNALGPVLARLEALERRVAENEAGPDRIAAISSQVEALSARDPASGLRGRLDEVDRQLSGLAAKQVGMAVAVDRTAGLARLEAAGIALAAGQPVGVVPDAPPALARFATKPPPTEAALRLSFPAAAHAALKVSVPDTEGKPFFDRVLARLQDFRLVTVREGDNVLVGNAAVSILTHAHLLLDAGDLSGAVRAVSALSGPPAEKMADWLAEAKALAAARDALATLAGKG